MSFLKAEWRKLVMVNYTIDSAVLESFVPAGTELDFFEENCYVSLVGFMFLSTKIKGVKIPFHVNFEEVNLRFYVKRKEGKEWKRGVVFIKEIVPKAMITWVANTVYKEHYATRKMKHSWEFNKESMTIGYSWLEEDAWQGLSVQAGLQPEPLIEGEEAEFISEHYWGYSRRSDTESNEYEVTHPSWKTYPVLSYEIDVDFGKTYGRVFSFLNDLTPKSVFLAEGSQITVASKTIIS